MTHEQSSTIGGAAIGLTPAGDADAGQRGPVSAFEWARYCLLLHIVVPYWPNLSEIGKALLLVKIIPNP